MKLLDNPEVIRWCYEGITKETLVHTRDQKKLEKYQKEEKEWARFIIGGLGSQWTTKLCEDLCIEALIKLGEKDVKKTKGKKSSIRDKKYEPDIESNEFVYEVKGRNWTTTGTAGEKILGVPLKYGEVPRLYSKQLRILLVGYQEFEARNKFGFGDLLDIDKQTPELRESLIFYKKLEIEYIGFTDILKKIGYYHGCWK